MPVPDDETLTFRVYRRGVTRWFERLGVIPFGSYCLMITFGSAAFICPLIEKSYAYLWL